MSDLKEKLAAAVDVVEKAIAIYEELKAARAELQDVIEAHRGDTHPSGRAWHTDGEGIPNTMDYSRVELDAKVRAAHNDVQDAKQAHAAVVQEIGPQLVASEAPATESQE